MGNCFSHIPRSRVAPGHKLTTPAMERKSNNEKNTRTGGQEVLDQEAIQEEADKKLTTPEVAPPNTSNTPPPAPRSRRNPAASRQTRPRLARSHASIGTMQFGPPLAAASSRLSAATMLSIDPFTPSSQTAQNTFASTHTGPMPVLLPGFPAGSGTYVSSGMLPGMQPAYNPFASNPYAGYPFSPVLNNSPSMPSGGVGMSGQPSSSFSAFGRPSDPGYYTSNRLSAMNNSNFDCTLQGQQATQNSNALTQGSSDISSSSSLAPSNSTSLEDRLAEAQSSLAELRARFSAASPAFTSSPENGTDLSMPGSMMPPPRRRTIHERDPTAALRTGLPAYYPQHYNPPSRYRQRRDYQGFVSIVTITEGVCGVDEDWGEEYLPHTVVEQQSDGTTNSHTSYTTFIRFDFRDVLSGN